MKVYIGLGSNLGDREAMLNAGIEGLRALPETRVVRTSSFYDTEPVGDPDQPRFLNAVAQLESTLTPRQLLWNLQLVERRLGRERTRRWGPRTLDLDLLLYGGLIVDEADLHVPHPELVNRSFVLVPLVELDPMLVHPVTQETMVAHLSRLPSPPPVRHGRRPGT